MFGIFRKNVWKLPYKGKIKLVEISHCELSWIKAEKMLTIVTEVSSNGDFQKSTFLFNEGLRNGNFRSVIEKKLRKITSNSLEIRLNTAQKWRGFEEQEPEIRKEDEKSETTTARTLEWTPPPPRCINIAEYSQKN